MKNKLVKVLRHDDKLLWYASKVGEVFELSREDSQYYWVREPDYPYCINWIKKSHAEVISGNLSRK